MTYVAHRCPNCGAPLAPPPPSGTVRCDYCASPLAVEAGRWTAKAPDASDEPPRDPGKPRVWIGGTRYALIGRLAADVHFARRDARVTELVVLKMAKEVASLATEWNAIEAMQKSRAEGAAHFARLLPQPVATGTARLGLHGDEGERPVSAFRWRSGFVHTMDDVLRAYPTGMPPGASIWMWKRVLELLGWVHKSGWTHGAVTPAHLLVHARDHGVVLVGWSRAAKSGDGSADIAQSAQSIQRLLQGAPEPLAKLLERTARTPSRDAWSVKEELDRIAREVFGPPKFVPFEMPA